MTQIFNPTALGGVEIKNRLVMAPMTRSRAQADGTPGDLAAEYYAQRAGVGLIIAESTQPSDNGPGYLMTPGIYTDSHVDGWRKVTDAVHGRGGRIFVQLMHANAPMTSNCRRYRFPALLMPPSFSLPPLEFFFGTNPIQALRSRPERKTPGSGMLAANAVATNGPTPGIPSSLRLRSLVRCHFKICRSICSIRCFNRSTWSAKAARHKGASASISGFSPFRMRSRSSSSPLRPIAATIPNSAKWARTALMVIVR
jgi:hypothetical protein